MERAWENPDLWVRSEDRSVLVRQEVAGNPRTPPGVLLKLLKDPDPLVQEKARRNPGLPPLLAPYPEAMRQTAMVRFPYHPEAVEILRQAGGSGARRRGAGRWPGAASPWWPILAEVRRRMQEAVRRVPLEELV